MASRRGFGPGSEPTTPEPGLRNRASSKDPQTPQNISPTSSTLSGFSPRLEPSRSIFNPSSSSLASSAFASPARKVIIRADPTLVTCFDPADKQLYDLWAPSR